MAKLVLALLGVVCLACSGSCQLSDEWMKKVENLGESVEFSCYVYDVHPEYNISSDYQIVEWMLPSFKRVGPGNSLGGVSVDPTGSTLTLNNTQKDDFGVYHCMLQDANSTWLLVKWGLNMRGPYFIDLVEKYTSNMIIGFSALGAFLVIAGAIFLIYKFRWQPPKGTARVEPNEAQAELPNYYEPEPAARDSFQSMKAEEAAAVAALASATAGEPDIPGTAQLMHETKPPSQREDWTEARIEGYSNPAATTDDGTQMGNTNF